MKVLNASVFASNVQEVKPDRAHDQLVVLSVWDPLLRHVILLFLICRAITLFCLVVAGVVACVDR